MRDMQRHEKNISHVIFMDDTSLCAFLRRLHSIATSDDDTTRRSVLLGGRAVTGGDDSRSDSAQSFRYCLRSSERYRAYRCLDTDHAPST